MICIMVDKISDLEVYTWHVLSANPVYLLVQFPNSRGGAVPDALSW